MLDRDPGGDAHRIQIDTDSKLQGAHTGWTLSIQNKKKILYFCLNKAWHWLTIVQSFEEISNYKVI